MAMAALSPASVLASPNQVNPQVQANLQGSLPQVFQDAQRVARSIQTDTVTLSAQALKMASGENNDASDVNDREAGEAPAGSERESSATADGKKESYLVSYKA